MTREDLFKAIGMMDEERLARSNSRCNPTVDKPMEDSKMSTYSASSEYTGRKRSKIWVLAAVIGVLALLVGSITAIHYMIANAFTNDTAQTDISQLTEETFHLSADEVTSLSMRLCCTIDRDEVDMDYVAIQTAAPYTIEKQTETGWEPLQQKTDDWSNNRNDVMVWDCYDWSVEWFDTYGILESGTYRFTTVVVEELGPMSVEFTVGPQFTTENVHLSASEITPTSMRLHCTVDRDINMFGNIYIKCDEPYTIEKMTGNGWEQLPVKADVWNEVNDEVMVWDEYEWHVDWSTAYGVLESGTYRFTTVVMEGIDPISVEFTVNRAAEPAVAEAVEKLLGADAYCVQYRNAYEYGSFDNVTEQGREYLENFAEDAEITCYEYWKCGNDLLYLRYVNGEVISGMMYKDGIKYSLEHEGGSDNNPIIGWVQQPDLDINRLTDWATFLSRGDFGGEAEYAEDGSIEKVIRITESESFMDNNFDIDTTFTQTWDIVTTDPAVAAAKFAEQDVNVAQEFSWEEDLSNMKALDVEFVNTTAQPVTNASEAIAQAQAECTVEYTKILAYRDEEAGMWKVEFQIHYGYQGYQYVYLDDDGITRMVSASGSKVDAWKYKYPDP